MKQIVYLVQSSQDEAFYGELDKKIKESFPQQFNIISYECSELDNDKKLYERSKLDIRNSDFLIIDVRGGLTYFNRFKDLYDEFCGKKKMFILSGIEDEIVPLINDFQISLSQYSKIEDYIRAGGIDNYINKILYISNEILSTQYSFKEPKYTKYQCLYTPDGPVKDEEEYLKNYIKSTKTKVGVIVHEHRLRDNDMKTVDELYNSIIRNGGEPLILVTNTISSSRHGALGMKEALKFYFTKDEKPTVGTIINTTGMSISILASPGDGSEPRDTSIFELTKVPVIQGMQTYYSYEQWKKSLAGLDNMMLSSCVYQPEFDGQIITVPVATREVIETHCGKKNTFLPIKDRVDKVCKLAVKWARLKDIPNKDKKVAIIFHNMPPRNDMIGCAFGLDTPESVNNMVKALKKDGVNLEYDFENGDSIIQKITDGLTNDLNWMPYEEILEKSVDTVSGEKYREWFNELSDKVKNKMTSDWGEAPGEFMVSKGEMLIPGIINGNVFIGLQPPRAYEEKAEEVYHNTDIVCPHQYIGFYKWVENIFKADVIVHVGTHGTIEWLPGKEIGLSRECYSDIAIGTLPHLYVYNIAVVGEGMQAKRRSHAALIGHMIPSMRRGGVYGELAEMDDLIDDYYHAKTNTPNRLNILYDEIWDLALKLNLNRDLGVLEKPSYEEIKANEFVERIHLWIEKIKQSEVRDGLHIMGEMNDKERFANLCRLLVRVRNGEIPSLREGICEMEGYYLEDLLKGGAEVLDNGKTKAMALAEVDIKGEEIFHMLMENDFNIEDLEIKDMGEKLKSCLNFVSKELVLNLKKTTDEIDNFIDGINGKFVSPGPAGNPSRGNAHILPTGRNFYSIDPGAIPSKTAWKVGKILGDQIIERELKERKKYPESVAIVVYAGDTMKTHGEDIAEALYLMGAKPVWLGNIDRVIGIEVIPMEELKRPRIDVTLRISGLFRDTFPNMIERIEDAVNLIASLDESAEENYIVKHIAEEIKEMEAKGITGEKAMERASARIFGCPPGAYGVGVDVLLNSKKWENSDDLGKTYIQWSGHAYGRHLRGEKFQDELKKRLSKTTVTIKNECSVEIDMLDSDDFYSYHGGLIAAVKSASNGEKPNSYSTNSADIQNVETVSINEETARIMRARINNPKWIEGLKRHGYKGAQEVSSMVDIVFGWDATSENIEDWMYDDITKNFVFNKENSIWIQEVNPWAMHSITERLLEANQRGMWNADKDILDELKMAYLEAEGAIEEII